MKPIILGFKAEGLSQRAMAERAECSEYPYAVWTWEMAPVFSPKYSKVHVSMQNALEAILVNLALDMLRAKQISFMPESKLENQPTVEKRSFSADIDHFSSTLKARFEKAISEAVVNSAQANAENVFVILNIDQDMHLNNVKIIDDGDGFNRKNCDSFFILHSANKKDIGGKGIGRITWFKFFSNVSVDSIFSENGISYSVNFKINKNQKEGIDIHRVRLENIKQNRTEISLNIYLGRDVLGISTSAIKTYLIREMVKILYSKKKNNQQFNVIIKKINQGSELESSTITLDDAPIIEKEYKFSAKYEDKKYDFVLNCIQLKTSQNNKVDTGFIAGDRTTSSFKDVFGLDIRAPQNRRTGQYWFLLESSFFNDTRFTSEDRERVTIPQFEPIFETIKEGIIDSVSKYFDYVAPENGIEREQILSEISELYPQYQSPQYQNIIDELLVTRIGRVDKNYVLRKLHEYDFRKEKNLKEELKSALQNKKIDSTAVEDTINIARKTNAQAKEVLIDYMWYRHAIIEQLQKFVTDNEKSEDLIHNLFCERFTTHTSPSQMNCIWLLDDKFMNFSYLASEGICDKVISDIYQSQDIEFHKKKRMDMFILFDRNDDSLQKDCVIIEFKAFDCSSDDKANAVVQVQTRYANVIRNHVKNIKNIYIYIITTIDDELKLSLEALDFNQSFSRHGSIYTKYASKIQAFINYVCASAIVGDAKDRHDFFFKILKEELSYRERVGSETKIEQISLLN